MSLFAISRADPLGTANAVAEPVGSYDMVRTEDPIPYGAGSQRRAQKKEWEEEQWRRVSLGRGVELHYEDSLNMRRRQAIEQIIEKARADLAEL